MTVIAQTAKAEMHDPALSNQGPFSADAESLTCGAEKCRVSGFDSQTWALEDGFDTPFGDLPAPVRQRVERYLFPMLWDSLSAEHRRTVALQWDYLHDPEADQDRQYWWDFFEKLRATQGPIRAWAETAGPTASDLALKETRPGSVRQERTRRDQQELQARRDYYPVGQRRDGGVTLR